MCRSLLRQELSRRSLPDSWVWLLGPHRIPVLTDINCVRNGDALAWRRGFCHRREYAKYWARIGTNLTQRSRTAELWGTAKVLGSFHIQRSGVRVMGSQ